MERHRVHKWLVLFGTGLSSIIFALDFTIVNTILAVLQSDLSATLNQLQWVMAGFGLTFSAFLAVSGRIADLFGRRLLLYISMAGFGLASIGAGLSETAWELILFRLLQGAFGAPLFPAGLALTAEAFPEKERGRALGIYGSFIGIGLAFGPVVGGLIVSIVSWHWVFFLNVPVILISLLICIPVLKESKAEKKIPVDWLGMITLILGLGSLIFGISQGEAFGWLSWKILVSFALAIGFLALFFWVQVRSPHALLPLRFFMNRGFFLSCMVYMASISFIWAILFLAPLYLQNVLDYSPGQAGVTLLSMSVMTMIASPLSGVIYDKFGRNTAIFLTFALLVISYIFQLYFSRTGPLWLIIVAFIFYGLAWGSGNGIGAPLALSESDSKQDAGAITGAAITVLNVFGVLTLVIIGTLFRYAEKLHLYSLFSDAKISLTQHDEELVRSLLSDPDKASSTLSQFSSQLATKIVDFFQQSFVASYHVAVWILLVSTVVIFFALLPALKKRKQN